MSQSRQVKLAHRGWGAFRWLLNLFLLVLLIVQVGLGAWLTVFGRFEIPGFILKKIKDELVDYGIALETGEVTVNIRGFVFIRELSLRFVTESQPDY